MIEGHGTGTRLGDRTELRSLAQTYGSTAPGTGAVLGSVKSNVGHAQAAAGALGLAKVLVAADHGAVPASLHTDRRQPRNQLGRTRFAVGHRTDSVARRERPADRRGVGIRHERDQRPRDRRHARRCRPPDGRQPVARRAHPRSAERARRGPGRPGRRRDPERTWIGATAVVNVADVAATLLRTRRLRRHRAVVRAADLAELRDGLRALAEGDEHPLVVRSSGNSAPRTAFVFPGQGSQWPSMGVEAYDRLPEYRAEADKCAAAFDAVGAASPMRYLLADPATEHAPDEFSQVEIQGAQFVHGVALARVWRSCGVLPDITVGHSLGEIGAAYVAGTITLSDAVGVVVARATLLDGLTGPYRVAVLGVTPDEAQAAIDETPGWVELSVVNSRTSVAVSGDTDAIATIVRTVADRGYFAREIDMRFPAHTTALDPLAVRARITPSHCGIHRDARAVHRRSHRRGRGTEHRLRRLLVHQPAQHRAIRRRRPGRGRLRCPRVRRTLRPSRAAVRHGRPARRFERCWWDRADATSRSPTGCPTTFAAVAVADPGYRWADLVDGPREPLRNFPFAPMRSEHHWASPEPLPPVAGLTVAVEHWEELRPARPPPLPGASRCSALDAGSDRGGIARRPRTTRRRRTGRTGRGRSTHRRRTGTRPAGCCLGQPRT